MKQLIKEYSIKYCINKARARKNEVADLEYKLDRNDNELKTVMIIHYLKRENN